MPPATTTPIPNKSVQLNLLDDPDFNTEVELPPLTDVIPKEFLRKLKPKEKKRQEVINGKLLSQFIYWMITTSLLWDIFKELWTVGVWRYCAVIGTCLWMWNWALVALVISSLEFSFTEHCHYNKQCQVWWKKLFIYCAVNMKGFVNIHKDRYLKVDLWQFGVHCLITNIHL